MVCLETAQPAKFAATIREALGVEPPLPAGYADLEGRPLRYEVMDVDVAAIKAFIEARS
jgi:threonine synthase